jgi:hypothetical protein
VFGTFTSWVSIKLDVPGYTNIRFALVLITVISIPATAVGNITPVALDTEVETTLISLVNGAAVP